MSSEPSARNVRWEDAPGYVALIAGCAALGLAGRTYLLVGGVAALIALHPLLGRWVAWPWSPPPGEDGAPPLLPLRAIPFVVFMLPFAAMTQILEVRGRSGLGLNVPWYTSLFLLSVATLKLYAPWDTRRWSVVLFASASAIATCGADLKKLPYIGFILVVGLAIAAGLRLNMPQRAPARTTGGGAGARRERAPAALGVAVLVSMLAIGGVSTAGSLTVKANIQDMRKAYQRWMSDYDLLPASPGGFSDEAQIGDVEALKHDGAGRTVALRVIAETTPGYLRGRTFLRYGGGSWTVGEKDLLLVGRRTRKGWANLPDRPKIPRGAEPSLLVTPTERYGAHLFLPLHTSGVRIDDKVLNVYPGNALKPTGASSARGYGVLVDPEPVRDAVDREEWTAPPEDPELVAAIDELVARLRLKPRPRRPGLLVERLRAYFEDTYTYQFGITFEEGRDPLAQFLTEKRHGHCQLFASAGALILRRLGVATRLVTGFVCAERSEYAEDQWIARNQHAHAWVEFYDPQHGWSLAELTPPGALPAQTPPSRGEAFMDWLGGQWERLKLQGIGAMLKELLIQLGHGMMWLVGAWWRVAILAGLIVGLLLRSWLRRRAVVGPLTPVRVLSPEVAAARDEYLALEQRLARHGLRRADGETLLEFARRVAGAELPEAAEAAARIEAFSALRYA